MYSWYTSFRHDSPLKWLHDHDFQNEFVLVSRLSLYLIDNVQFFSTGFIVGKLAETFNVDVTHFVNANKFKQTLHVLTIWKQFPRLEKHVF